jgi:RND family efflux transporter MFP subunit
MKTLVYIFSGLLLIASCNQPSIVNQDSPEAKKQLLEEKKAQLAALEKEIESLTAEVNALFPNENKVVVSVTYDTVKADVFNRYIDLQAVVEPNDIVNASSELGGRIVRLAVKEGQNVKKGQLIATMDAESLEKQKEEVLKALDLANDVYERQKRLWEQNIGSEVQYLQAKNTKERTEKSLQTLETQLKKRNVYAPINGIVDMLLMKEGEMTAPGTPVVRLLNVSKVKVVADVPESYLGKIKTGDPISLSFPALGKEMKQRVSQLGRTIDPANRTFKMEVWIDNPDGSLKPNLLSIVKVNDLTIKDAVSISVDLVQQEVNGRKYVYVVQESGDVLTAAKKYIETGESADGKMVVTSGLNKGDKIIVKGARTVSDGTILKIES